MKHYYATDLATVCISENERRILELAGDIRRANMEQRFPEQIKRADFLLLDIARTARFKYEQGAAH